MSINSKLAAALIAVLALCATNLMTLLNDSFHVKAHDLITSIVGGFISTSNSTVNRTRGMRVANEELIAANRPQLAIMNADFPALPEAVIDE